MIIFEFWFLLFLGFFIVLGILSSEFENFGLGTATFVVGLCSLQWFFDVPVWQSIIDNPISIVLYLVVYTIVGLTYTLLWRWPEFLRVNAKSISDSYADYKRRHPEDSKQDFLASRFYTYKASDYKRHIATWALTWPFSAVWELSRKPIKYLYRVIYSLLGDVFERVGLAVANRILNKH